MTPPMRRHDEARTVSYHHQPGRGRPVLRHGAHGKRGGIRTSSRLRHLRRHPLGATQHLRAPGVAKGPAQLPTVRRGQWTQPPRGREGPHQPLRLPQLRGHTRLPEGERRGGRRHWQAAVHRQLQDQAHPSQDLGDVGTQGQAAGPRRNQRRALSGWASPPTRPCA